jgi:hypothetical protein
MRYKEGINTTQPFRKIFMTYIYAELNAMLAMDAEPSPLLSSSLTVTRLNGVPLVSEITVATFNFYDNGAGHKVKWSSGRYSMNVQLFTQTTPFTPSKALADWKGTIQLHDPGFWHNNVEAKHQQGIIDKATYDRLTGMCQATYRDESKVHPLIGTFVDKNSGTNYSWPFYARFWTDATSGDPAFELVMDEAMPVICIWQDVKTSPDKHLPILRGKFNPHGLWVSKGFKK